MLQQGARKRGHSPSYPAAVRALSEYITEVRPQLVDAVDGDLAGLTDRIRAVADAAGSYTSFSGNGGAEDQVKFVYRTQAIKEN